ncbi:gamma-glutamyl peptidase 5 [Manihot esculenta]|uniref:Glutamine amidotransferase domain-containing protein n=1 Tax=Manihot esculenta TaxID=3983 RepID=A0A2C9V628_MANES|nr:gamma-glutamyl peptidase 5 [Manihot esculenta]OAY39471.1 hypothetical protein MANES_10G096900v8 [Manihot esculenta]
MGGKKFAVLLCAEDSEYVKKKYGGYFGVFVRMLGEEGETWVVYKVASGEFPDDDEIKTFDGFVITGSCNDAHGTDLWIRKLLILLNKLNSMKKKVLGICFGHQILARSLGGKTGRAVSGWDMGITAIHFASSTKLFSSVKVPASLSVIECHRDEVRELPPEAEVIAWSDKTGIEMFRYEDHIMGIQGHPEYNRDILTHLLDRLLQRNLIVESFADEVKANLDGQEPDREAWKKLCTNFLKGRL